MKIAVCGSAAEKINDDLLSKAKEIGKEIAKRNHILLTGACLGFPYFAVKGAKELNGQIIGYSPARNKEEHISVFNYPLQEFAEIRYNEEDKYTDVAIMTKSRNLALVNAADAVILIGGRCGTLNEFTIAYDSGKIIGVLEGTGGITKFIQQLIEDFNKSTKSEIFYDSNPNTLLDKIEKAFKEEII